MPMNGERSFRELIGDLARETSTLFRQEIHLARAEMGEKASQASNGVISISAGALVIYAGFLVLLFALVVALNELLSRWTSQAWIAPLIVGVIVAAIGFVVMRKGRTDLEARNLLPRRTAHNLRRDRDVIGGHPK